MQIEIAPQAEAWGYTDEACLRRLRGKTMQIAAYLPKSPCDLALPSHTLLEALPPENQRRFKP